jgi:programmed cell death 6-interacting protein
LSHPSRRYYRYLISIENRFPISAERGTARVPFVWYDAIRSTKKATQNNIHFEKAALLFNLGACASQQGLAADRTTGEGLKLGCQMFQVLPPP